MIKNNSNYTIVLKHTDSISHPTRCILKNLYCKCTYCSVWKVRLNCTNTVKRGNFVKFKFILLAFNGQNAFNLDIRTWQIRTLLFSKKFRVLKIRSFPKRSETVTACKNLTPPPSVIGVLMKFVKTWINTL